MKTSRWIAWGLAAMLCVGAARLPLTAQNELVPAEVSALFDDISDIDKMRVLNPLELTPEQLDRLIKIIRKSQNDFNRKLAEVAVPPIRRLAREIKETRRRLLPGGEVPKDLDEKVKKIQADFSARRAEEEYNTLKSVSDAVREVLTKEQVKTAVMLARTLTMKDGKPTLRGEDDKFFNGYVLGTFILYPRIIPLLEDMKQARSRATEAGRSPDTEARP